MIGMSELDRNEKSEKDSVLDDKVDKLLYLPMVIDQNLVRLDARDNVRTEDQKVDRLEELEELTDVSPDDIVAAFDAAIDEAIGDGGDGQLVDELKEAIDLAGYLIPHVEVAFVQETSEPNETKEEAAEILEAEEVVDRRSKRVTRFRGHWLRSFFMNPTEYREWMRDPGVHITMVLLFLPVYLLVNGVGAVLKLLHVPLMVRLFYGRVALIVSFSVNMLFHFIVIIILWRLLVMSHLWAYSMFFFAAALMFLLVLTWCIIIVGGSMFWSFSATLFGPVSGR